MTGKSDIAFLPRGTTKARKGLTLLEAARESSIEIEASCNGNSTCGKCTVELVEGEVSPPHDDEITHLGNDQLASGVRLACRSTVTGNATFRVVDHSKRKLRILSDGIKPHFELNPRIRKRYVELPKPTLEDQLDDLGRIGRLLGREIEGNIEFQALQRIPAVLRAGDFRATLLFSGERLIGIEEGDTSKQCYGVAVDIGTTTVVAALADLTTGEEIGTASMLNPQKEFGLDVLTRIQHTKNNAEGLKKMSSLIRECVNRLINELCLNAGIPTSRVYEVVFAANATMMHFLLGMNAESLGSSPYTAAFTAGLNLPAREVDLCISEFGNVYCLPAVSSYIGADIVAGMLVTGLGQAGEKALFIDIGTNGEIVLETEAGLYACSCAAGPALEGMNISCGIRAADGAIEKIFIDDDVKVETVGKRPPVGICGSGIIDAVGELVKIGAVNRSGRFKKEEQTGHAAGWRSRLKEEGGKKRFVIHPREKGRREIAVTQKDIREVQLSKGAILSGIMALTREMKIDALQIEKVYVAGAFGHHIRMESLARLGVIPEEHIDKVILAGNSSKTGALLCLLSKEKRERAAEIARNVRYVELSCYPDYDRLFAECMAFPSPKEGPAT